MRRRVQLIAWACVLAVAAPIAAQPARPGGTAEGVKVHGRWDIDVRNPDGTLSSHAEFDNALHPSGASLLAGLLSRTMVAGSWMIVLGGGTAPCSKLGTPSAYPCFVTEPAAPAINAVDANRNLTLHLTYDANDELIASMSLTGTALVTNPNPSTISSVSSGLGICVDQVTPAACAVGPFGTPRISNFTAHVLPTPITLVAGQTVHVTVTFTFS